MKKNKFSYHAKQILQLYEKLSYSLTDIPFSCRVYAPLLYAREPWGKYVQKIQPHASIIFFGINPGPWGMVQNGVPFGDSYYVKNWLQIQGAVIQPSKPISSRPVWGMNCERREISGKRLWGLFADLFDHFEDFFARASVLNYCPLAFFTQTPRAANLTPDKLPSEERKLLLELCDETLSSIINILKPQYCVAIGRFSEIRLDSVIKNSHSDQNIHLLRIPHPSPINPRTHKNWAGQVLRILYAANIWKEEIDQAILVKDPLREQFLQT